MRYWLMSLLGSGSFGAVYKALDYDTGRFMAVKRLVIKNDQEFMYARKREVDTLARIRHPHIVKFIHSEGWSTGDALISVGLKDGSLGSLFRDEERMDIATQEVPKIAQLVLHYMLQALGFLVCHKIVHRDVKPDNILYLLPKTNDDAPYRFQLGGCGLHSNTERVRALSERWQKSIQIECASAAQLLVKWFDGKGLTTPTEDIAPFED
ncbi:MAG: hypothetical protein LQ337_007435 [Flavoplaca oasis]|nr:MAG: hypothetical protein LQ337_007435 [Flavoplaca oasis]